MAKNMIYKIAIIVGIVAASAFVGYEIGKNHKKVTNTYNKIVSSYSPKFLKNMSNKCSADSECNSDSKCINGKCGQGCSATQDCPQGKICYMGACVNPYNFGKCDSNSACSGDYGCSPDGECVAPSSIECVGDGKEYCPDGWGCYGGYCKSKCDSHSECGNGQLCMRGKCKQVRSENDID